MRPKKDDEKVTLEKLLAYIKKYVKANEYAPSKSKIATHFQTTRQNIDYHFKMNKTEIEQFADYKKYFVEEKSVR